jgi:hypothetical protein
VRGAVIEASKIELKFGEPEAPEATTTNPWDRALGIKQ